MPVTTIEKNDPNKDVRDDLEKALSNSYQKNLVFPNDLDQIDHWVAFRVHKQEFRRAKDFPVEVSGTNIFMPLPLGLATQYTQNYSTEGIGPAGIAGARAGASFLNGGVDAIVDTIKNAGLNQFTDAAGYYAAAAAEENLGAFIGGAIGGTTGAVIGAAGGQFIKGAIAGAGVSRNPYMSVMYEAPSLRSHQFTWKMIPRNQKESEVIRNIIYKFKYHSAPGMSSFNPHFFDYPEQFDIDFHYPKYLYNIGPSVLTDFSVDYHAEGQPLYHDLSLTENEIEIQDDNGQVLVSTNKAPVAVEISATFQEVSTLSKERIERDNR